MAAARVKLKDSGKEQRLFFGRLLFCAFVAVALVVLLVGRLVHLQVLNHNHFSDLSQGNRIRIEPIPPTRGLIYDRNGVVLAENLPAYGLEMIPEQVPDIDETLARLAALSLIRDEDRARVLQLIRRQRRFEPVALNFRMSDEQVAEFAVQRQHFPGVDIRARLRRHHPYADATAHVLGYMGGISAEDLERLERANYAGTPQVGKTGVERSFEEHLHGTVGYRQVVVNARGRVLQRLEALETDAEDPAAGRSRQPRPGRDLVLSLDIDLQLAAYEAMQGLRGAVVALDPSNGDVLALVSTPSFDPNSFHQGIGQREYQALLNDPANPLFNRAVRGVYPPGSTIKPMVGLALLEHNVVDPDHRHFCPGHFSLPGSSHRFRDWRRQGHGPVDLYEAIAQSCDVYFYSASTQLGIDRLHDFLRAVGLGEPTGIDLLGERAGLVPSRDWKRRAFSRREDQVWFPGETVIASIGQGYMTTTPLQLAHSTAIVAARGLRLRPRLATAGGDVLGGELEAFDAQRISRLELRHDHHWDRVHEAMIGVSHGSTGTARTQMRGMDYQVAGKTGTAQVFSIAQGEEYDERVVPELLRDHALFVAFAPADAPEIAIAVVVENGGSGSGVAAPIARQILEAYLPNGSQP